MIRIEDDTQATQTALKAFVQHAKERDTPLKSVVLSYGPNLFTYWYLEAFNEINSSSKIELTTLGLKRLHLKTSAEMWPSEQARLNVKPLNDEGKEHDEVLKKFQEVFGSERLKLMV